MRGLVTLILALVASLLLASIAAVFAAERTEADEGFILVFLAIPAAALVAGIAFLIAAARPVPARAQNRVTVVLLLLLVLGLAGLSALELADTGTLAAARRGWMLLGSVFGAAAIVVVVQWIVFRWRGRGVPATQMPRFGRGAAP